ncbi:MAG: hypothetical protein ABI243_05335 [Lapillicoccus sp.]
MVRGRPSLRTSLYVVVVAVIAAVGFVGHTPLPIIGAAVLAAPASAGLVPCYYLAYGLLAQVPGANPATSSGHGTVMPDGTRVDVVDGAQAVWFVVTTQTLGIVTLALAACLNVVILRAIASGKPFSRFPARRRR